MNKLKGVMAPIPKIIHQVWFKLVGGPIAPPAEYDEMRASWRSLHPDWVFMEWDLEKSRAFLLEHYPQYLALFDSYKRDIFRIDAIRYFILHFHGGYYVDCDTTAVSSIECLRNHTVVLALNKYTKNRLGIYNNHFMGGAPGSKFFKACIERLPTASLLQTEKSSFISVMGTAGPFYLTTIASYHKRKGEIYTLPYHEEIRLFTHHEHHSWKLARNILNDVLRIGVVTGGLVAGGFMVKHLSDYDIPRLEKRKVGLPATRYSY
jgi:mannosyltransferase OCH1-like enzyme